MIVYTVPLDPARIYATLAEAVAEARAALQSPDYDHADEFEIERCEIVPLTKDSIIEIINSNGGSWCRSSEVVKTVRRKGARA